MSRIIKANLNGQIDSQYLIDNKYAAPGKVAINGGSNGGTDKCVSR